MNLSDVVLALLKPIDKIILQSLSVVEEKTFYRFTKDEIGANSAIIASLQRLEKVKLIVRAPPGERNRQPYIITDLGKELVQTSEG